MQVSEPLGDMPACVPPLPFEVFTCDGGCHSGGDSGIAPEALVSAAHCWCAMRACRCCRCVKCAPETALQVAACSAKQVSVRSRVACTAMLYIASGATTRLFIRLACRLR